MLIIRFSDLPVGAMVQFTDRGEVFRIEEKSDTFIRIRGSFNPDLVIIHTRNLDRLIFNYQLIRH